MLRIGSGLAALVAGAMLLVGAPSYACARERSCPCHHEATAAEAALEAKCSCAGQADCTCKKGQCQCPKCGVRRTQRAQVVAPLKGHPDALPAPSTARTDASAGGFI